MTRILRLSCGQHVSGQLLRVDEKKVSFVTSWGQAIIVDREQIVSIEPAADTLLLWHDDFEASLNAWRVDGKPMLSREWAFFGKSSLLLAASGQRLERTWMPPLRDGSIRLYFHDSGQASSLRWAIALVSAPPRKVSPTLVVDSDGYACANTKKRFGTVKPTLGWHVLHAALSNGRLRIFVEDRCLGETELDEKETIQGIRFSAEPGPRPGKESGKLWIDEVSVARRLPELALPVPDRDQDMLWLEQGEQLFGRILSADSESVTLEAKFGKRTLAWSRLRGILFAQKKAALLADGPEITFRPGSGFPVDYLRAKLVRWEGTRLIVVHSLFGEIAIERERLHTIRMAAR